MQVKRYILQGTIGSLRSIKSLTMWPRAHAYYTRNGWAGKLMVDGVVVNDSPFNNAMAHELMMMLFQAGSDERVAATPTTVRASHYRANVIESPDTVSLEMASRQTMVVTMAHKATTIQPVAGEDIVLKNGDTGTVIPGIKDELRSAFEEERRLIWN